MYGVDISEYQPASITASIPYDFVIIKATEGVTFVNPRCDQQYQAAKARGKLLGVYHFATGNNAPEREAEAFFNAVQGYLREAIMVLDFEQAAIHRWGDSGARRFLDHFTKLSGGIKPLIYAQASIISSLTSVAAGDYGLWLAAWDNRDYQGYRVPSQLGSTPFPFTVIRQYTSRGRLPGYGGNLDLDIAYIDKAAWVKYANPTSTTPASKPPVVKPTPAPTLVIDGIAGAATVSHVQRLLGTPADGIISGQIQALHNRHFPAFITVHYGGTGSPMVSTLQRKLGVTADGLLGRETITAWQKKLGVTADSIAGRNTVTALQQALNNGKLW